MIQEHKWFPHCFLVSGAAETGSHGVAPQRSGEPGNTIPGAGGTKGGEQLMRRAVLTIGKTWKNNRATICNDDRLYGL